MSLPNPSNDHLASIVPVLFTCVHSTNVLRRLSPGFAMSVLPSVYSIFIVPSLRRVITFSPDRRFIELILVFRSFHSFVLSFCPNSSADTFSILLPLLISNVSVFPSRVRVIRVPPGRSIWFGPFCLPVASLR